MHLPVIDLQQYIDTRDTSLCEAAANSLHLYGALCLKDNVMFFDVLTELAVSCLTYLMIEGEQCR